MPIDLIFIEFQTVDNGTPPNNFSDSKVQDLIVEVGKKKHFILIFILHTDEYIFEA
jgi:hypothetical protein